MPNAGPPSPRQPTAPPAGVAGLGVMCSSSPRGAERRQDMTPFDDGVLLSPPCGGYTSHIPSERGGCHRSSSSSPCSWSRHQSPRTKRCWSCWCSGSGATSWRPKTSHTLDTRRAPPPGIPTVWGGSASRRCTGGSQPSRPRPAACLPGPEPPPSASGPFLRRSFSRRRPYTSRP